MLASFQFQGRVPYDNTSYICTSKIYDRKSSALYISCTNFRLLKKLPGKYVMIPEQSVLNYLEMNSGNEQLSLATVCRIPKESSLAWKETFLSKLARAQLISQNG